MPGADSETVSTHNGKTDDAVTDYSETSNSTRWWRVSFSSTNLAQQGRNSYCLENTVLTFNNNAGPGTAP